ncbi:hypothetical protein [Mycoplasmopsis verecunda]|uniref:Uncharacterized protein n=1 Tax=Mycoplasmopsis verecunda TaxID=171291 RepID=A0A1T4KL81_9BACT|nr:hypothetical protein [Mycoplasmopsis verecunda]WPB54278.1 hypothetical protein SAM46_02200 [Mycoplasmopsis verecunda]SJZ43154.1 hypothetical protein SAMN02745154_00095 [Mycoplasmopsis verecunda]
MERWYKNRNVRNEINQNSNVWLLSQRIKLFHQSVFKQQAVIFASHLLLQSIFLILLVLGIVFGSQYSYNVVHKLEFTSYQYYWFIFIIASLIIFVYYNIFIYKRNKEFYFRLKNIYHIDSYSLEKIKTLIKIDKHLNIFPILSFAYRYFYILRKIRPQDQYTDILKNIYSINQFINTKITVKDAKKGLFKRKKSTYQVDEVWFLSKNMNLFKKHLFKQQFFISLAKFIYFAIFVSLLIVAIINAKYYYEYVALNDVKKFNPANYSGWYMYLVSAILVGLFYLFWTFTTTTQLNYRLTNYLTTDIYDKKQYYKLLKLNNVISYFVLIDFIYRWFFILKYTRPIYKYINSLKDIQTINHFLNLTSDSKFSQWLKINFSFSIIDLTMSSALLGLYLIITALTKFTGLSKLGLSFEYVFYIIFAIFFPFFKAILLGLLADFAGLLFTGSIWSWFWMYAIVPICVVLIAKFFLWMYKTNTIKASTTTVVLFIIIFLALASVTIYAAYLHNTDPSAGFLKDVFGTDKKNGGIQGFRITRTFGVSVLSDATLFVILSLSGILLIIITVLAIMLVVQGFRLTSKELERNKQLLFIKKLLVSLGLVVTVIVIMRWIYGPYVYIQYLNYFNGRGYLTSEKYIYFMMPIVFRSLISIPVYTALLIMISSPLTFFKEKILIQRAKLSY